MRNLKKTIAKLMAVVMMVTLFPATVYAETTNITLKGISSAEVYYTNENGVNFTREQYDCLREFYSDNEINVMQPGFAEPLFEHLYELTEEKEILYVQTLETVDANGNVDTTEKITPLTEEQMENIDSLDFIEENQPQRSSSATHVTASKTIELKFIEFGGSKRNVSLTCKWNKLPVTRSYDIMALAPSKSILFKLDSSTFSGYQSSDEKYTSYSYKSNDNLKITSTGIGISMNLHNGAKTKLECHIQCVLKSEVEPFTVYGTYQHAKSDISLSDSQKYSIEVSSSNMGSLLKFDSSSISGKYDNTQGLVISGTLDDH